MPRWVLRSRGIGVAGGGRIVQTRYDRYASAESCQEAMAKEFDAQVNYVRAPINAGFAPMVEKKLGHWTWTMTQLETTHGTEAWCEQGPTEL